MMAKRDPTSMHSRRGFLIAGLSALLPCSPAGAKSAPDPVKFIDMLYRDAVNGSEPDWMQPAGRVGILSRSLIALWARADRLVEPGDSGPIDFDMIADTQGLQLKDYALALEKRGATTATIAVTLTYTEGYMDPEPKVVRYDLVIEKDRWTIDNIRGKSWAARRLLQDSLRRR